MKKQIEEIIVGCIILFFWLIFLAFMDVELDGYKTLVLLCLAILISRKIHESKQN